LLIATLLLELLIKIIKSSVYTLIYNKSKLFLIKPFIADDITGNILVLPGRRFLANNTSFLSKYHYW